MKGLINDNPNLNHVLEQLEAVSDLLVKHKYDLADTLTTVANSLRPWVRRSPRARTSRLLANLLPGQILQPFVDCRVQEARYRPGGVLAQRRAAGIPVPRPQRAAVPQRCAAAGADGAGGHPGSSGPRGAGRVRRARTRRRPTACRRPGNPLPCADLTRRPVRRQPLRPQLRPARRGDVAAEPERSRPRRACPPRPSRVRCRRTCRAHRCRCRPLLPVRAPCRWARCPDRRTSPRHRAAAARADGSATATRTRPGRGPGRHAAAARQPAVPPAGIAGTGGCSRCRQSSTSET